MNPEFKPYFDALRAGKLALQQCTSCAEVMMYPRTRCVNCRSADLGWRDAQGSGELLSFTVIRAVPPRGFEDELPYSVGVVSLVEGVQLLGRLWPEGEDGWDHYRCRGRVVFDPAPAEEISARAVPWFRAAPPEIGGRGQ